MCVCVCAPCIGFECCCVHLHGVRLHVPRGATKQAFRLIPGVTACQYIDGHWYSSLDVQMSCAETYGVQAVSMMLLCCFTAGFPVYILWRVQKIDAAVEGSMDTTARAGPKASRFTTMARVAHIFTSRHRGMPSNDSRYCGPCLFPTSCAVVGLLAAAAELSGVLRQGGWHISCCVG